MTAWTLRHGSGRRHIRAVPDARRHDTPPEELVLSTEQQTSLRGLGFGPDAPRQDFTDPLVRAAFVQALRDCGALAPAPGAPPSPPLGTILRAG